MFVAIGHQPNTELFEGILDADGEAVADGGVGEVCIRGPNVTAGYENNPSANAEGWRNGWGEGHLPGLLGRLRCSARRL